MSELSKLFEPLREPEEANKTVTDSPYHYIVSYVVDNRNVDDPEILDYQYITVKGDMDSDMYFSEVVQNATSDDIEDITHDLGEGIFRLVFGLQIHADSHWTDCGYEYDEDHFYDLISSYQMTQKEIDVCWSGWCNLEDVEEFK